MGYSGATGASIKMLANLIHYGLVAKAGKGSVRVTETAVDILHPNSPGDRRKALHQAGMSPSFFQSIRTNFPDGMPTETWLRSFMVRQEFSVAAIEPAMTSYLETCRYLQNENAYESHGAPPPPPIDSDEIEELDGAEDMEAESDRDQRHAPPRREPMPTARRSSGVDEITERTVFTEEGGLGQYIVLKASGEVTDDMLEALEDYVKRQRKRLSRAD